MRQISLEDKVLNVMGHIALDKAGPVIFSLESELNRNIKSPSESSRALKSAKNIIGSYSGIYLALKQRICGEIKNPAFESQYLSYVSSSATLQRIFGYESSNSFPEKNHQSSSLTSVRFELSDAIKDMYESARHSGSSDSLNSAILNNIRFNLINSANALEKSEFIGYLEEVSGWAIQGNGFCVKFPEFRSKYSHNNEVENHVRGLKKHNLVPVCKESIIGNSDAIKLIETDVPCLIAYDPKEKRNPFSGFSSYIMFVGQPGTGKTMLARYAMTLGADLASKYNKPFSLVQLDIKDSWKNGSFLNLDRQFSEINSGDKIYMVFADEMDMALDEDDDSGAKEQFLRFRGGAEYQNKGNYMIIATSNKPSDIHSGILRVFNVINVEGPTTAEQKIDVLKQNLRHEAELDYLRISDWSRIFSRMNMSNFTGSDIYCIAERAKCKIRKIAGSMDLSESAKDIEKIIHDAAKSGDQKYVICENDIIEAIDCQTAKYSALRDYS